MKARLQPAVAGLVLLAVLAACAGREEPAAPEPQAPPVAASAPQPRPEGTRLAALRRERAETARRAEASPASPESLNMRTYLQGIEDRLVARGLLREDSAASDATVTAASLARDFVQIALFDEYGPGGGPAPAPLRRWEEPVRLQLDFGASVDAATRVRDRDLTARLAARLAEASGHPVSLVGEAGNFHVLVVTEDERAGIAPRLSALVPGLPAADVAAIRDLAPQNFCTVFAYSSGAGSAYAKAIAVIRAELPPRLRRSCFHEELAQGMGLANDSPAARPSVFNDDEEFALLTRHDELLLRMLYDPRLRPGMREADTRPIVQAIAAELIPGS